MGIPYYYYNIIRRNEGLLFDKIDKCDRLFLDFNSIIHKCSALVVERSPQTYTWHQIFEEIASYTKKIVDICKPRQLLYIAVDGVAPRAKIQQQRKRRYMSVYRNNQINNFKKSNNLPISTWDSNCITPGTDFMKALDTFLRNDSTCRFLANKEIIISGHEEDGEGEHKIFKYVNTMSQLKKDNQINVIYGLDADLIMLSLNCDEYVYLFRESQEFKRNDTPYKFMDINAFKKIISKQVASNSIHDYIFLCFFIGNDFLPSINFLKIREGAIDTLCDTHRKVYTERNETIIIKETKGFTINYSFLIRFLELLSKLEDDGLQNAVDIYDKIQFNPHKKFHNKLDRFIYELESNPIICKFPSNLISPHSDNKWRMKYYYHLFGKFDSTFVKQCSINYIEGLLWTINYYFNKKYNTSWFYSFEYSPCVSDIYKYTFTMENEKMDELLVNLQKPSIINIDSIMQMLMVLPPQSSNLVPSLYRELMCNLSSNCVQYFPHHFKFTTFLKAQLWECNPILPQIDIDHLQECVVKRMVK